MSTWSMLVLEPTMHWTEGKRPRVLEVREKGPRQRRSRTDETRDWINKRSETVDEKIKKLDAELARYKEQIKKTRPGPVQEAVKARAMRVLKQKRTYEGQRDMLYNQTFNLDQVEFASEGIKDAKQTRPKGHGSRDFRRSLFCTLIGTCCLPYVSFEIGKQKVEKNDEDSADSRTCKMRCDGP
ncbi:Vacuolar protein sorting-associated protein 60.1 [Camellia lanceoleosa]|uniref:Vacuolar protein sorting-associated protein 60.1 n=1 Tax=Camellia lanceoleosa TaxID=1840588 RepID=A0ACC0J2Y0_9ERIC|nr:Vacuolar protein sorting-associated protein 60.1 [Camellia lanceoleosa]